MSADGRGDAETIDRLAWRASGYFPSDETPAALLAADSWRIDDGHALAFDLHVDRFVRSVGIAGGDADAAHDAIQAAKAHVPQGGSWFPRIDATPDGFSLAVRVSPERRTTATLWTSPFDPREQPGIKGPDLPALAELRLLAAESGASEAIITTDDGAVIEGAYSSLAWWRGDILHMPPPDFERVDSITAKSVLGVATALGVGVVWEAATPEALDGSEVWIMSALHGVRGVTGWVDGPATARPTRAASWNARLDALRRPWT